MELSGWHSGFFFSFLLKRGRSLVCDKQPPSTTKLPARAGIIHGLCAAGGAQQAEHLLLLRRREAKEAAWKLMSVTRRGSAAVVYGRLWRSTQKQSFSLLPAGVAVWLSTGTFGTHRLGLKNFQPLDWIGLCISATHSQSDTLALIYSKTFK